jgi:hypothetical protein
MKNGNNMKDMRIMRWIVQINSYLDNLEISSPLPMIINRVVLMKYPE